MTQPLHAVLELALVALNSAPDSPLISEAEFQSAPLKTTQDVAAVVARTLRELEAAPPEEQRRIVPTRWSKQTQQLADMAVGQQLKFTNDHYDNVRVKCARLNDLHHAEKFRWKCAKQRGEDHCIVTRLS